MNGLAIGIVIIMVLGVRWFWLSRQSYFENGPFGDSAGYFN